MTVPVQCTAMMLSPAFGQHGQLYYCTCTAMLLSPASGQYMTNYMTVPVQYSYAAVSCFWPVLLVLDPLYTCATELQSPGQSRCLPLSPEQPFLPCPHSSLNHGVHKDSIYCILTGIKTKTPTLQRHNAEHLKQIFPEKELCGHSPTFHVHVSVSFLHIPTIDLPILLQEICGSILGI